MKEIVFDACVILFIGLLTAGAKHLHAGKCAEGPHRPAYARSSNSP